MNEPEYILIDALEDVVSRIKTALNLPVLDFKYGYLAELKTYLQQLSKDDPIKKYPLVWVRYPFSITHDSTFFGATNDLTMFIIAESNTDRTAKRRMTEIFKPIIYPIYRRLMIELNETTGISYDVNRKHTTIDRFYWGSAQQSEIDDVIDCMEISNIDLTINNNLNLCQ
jgi:hypothetical protein